MIPSTRRLALCLSLALAPAVASASPLLGDHALPAAVERAVAEQVRAARAAHPEHFARVERLRGLDPRVYRATRLGRPSVSQELRAMGADALFPLVELLALRDAPRALSADERFVLEVASLEALGALGDHRATPVVRAAFERADDPEVLRAAARALGALGGDDALAALTTASRRADARGHAALEGLGLTRRPEAVRALTDALASRDEAAVSAAARGLMEAGATWGRGVALPPATLDAMARAYAAGVARSELMVALAATASADTLRAVQAARAGAGDGALRALASLERVVRRSLPTR